MAEGGHFILHSVFTFMRPLFPSWILLLCVSCASAETVGFGRIIDPIECVADPGQRYVLYVPSHYSADRTWPVIFCFDPSARGRIPVERLQPAAEKYGYILAGSLTSRNGAWENNLRAADAMVQDVSRGFAIDTRRIYTAGMSGGARVATGLGLSGFARGAIACGAGFPTLAEGMPLRISFGVFGAAGIEDFNHAELRRLDHDLDVRQAAHRIVEFDGGHEWAPVSVFTEAVEWLELLAMRTGTRSKDDATVRAILQTRLAALPAAAGLDRWRALKSITADFKGLADLAGFELEEKELAVSSIVKTALKSERTLAAREEKMLVEIEASALRSLARKKIQAEEVNRIADAPKDTPVRRAARRARNGFIAMTRERLRSLLDERQYREAISVLEMVDLLRPGQSRTHFDLARAHALNRDDDKALIAFEKAVVAGFADSDRARTEPGFARLQTNPRFIAALAQIHTGPAPAALELPVMRVSAALASVELRPFYLPNSGGAELPVSFLRVERVAPDSTAAHAGLEAGMEVLSIQGVRMRSLNEDDLNQVMALTAHEEIVITVREPPSKTEKEIRIPLRRPKPAPNSK